MDRRKAWTVGLAVLLLILAVTLGYTLTRQPETPAETEAAEEARETTQDACASRDTFDGLKRLVFEQAYRGRAADPTNFDMLAASAFVRMEDPVVQSTDASLGRTACAGRFILELPPGAERAFDGERRLTADVRYEVQEAADGSGPVYTMSGAEAIVARLAAFELPGQRLQMPPAAEPFDPLANGFEPAVPPVSPDTDRAAPIPVPPPLPVPPPSPPPGRQSANPSFDCRDARSRSELMVCGSGRLAAKDRAMSSLFFSALDDADRRQRRRLESTRNRFLAYRDRCPDEACVAEAYDGRMQEIRDIMAEAD